MVGDEKKSPGAGVGRPPELPAGLEPQNAEEREERAGSWRGPALCQNGDVLIQKRFWEPIASGDVTLVFRRWKRPQVITERTYRTAAGRLEVSDVTTVELDEITVEDARRAGFESVEALIAEFRNEPTDPVYRIEFRYLDEPDPRTELANQADLEAEDVAEIDRRLERLDQASSRGPWTLETLELIEANPERRAPDLAEMVGRETKPFKLDVRKLKNLGLTLSFRIGYRLSPRGEAYLSARRSDPDGPQR
jgi:hypothetical protein